MLFYFCQIVFASILGAIGQVFFKIGSKAFDGGLLQIFIAFLTNKFLFFGLVLYGISTLIYVTTLRHVSLSIAYPTIATSYITVVFLSHFFLGESLSIYKILGSVIILIGVCVLWIK